MMYRSRNYPSRYPRRFPYPVKYYDPDAIEQRDIWSANVCPYTKVILLGDSMVKYVTDINNTQIIAFKGIRIEQLAVRILQNKIPHLKGKHMVVTHAGTNNVQSDSPDEMVSKTCFLIDTIRKTLPNAKILVSLVLPRPCDFNNSDHKAKEYNFAIRDLSSDLQIQTIPAYRKFLCAQTPLHDLYAVDRLHLNPAGTIKLQAYFSSFLGRPKSEAKIKKTKRKPPPTIIMEKIKQPKRQN